MLVDGAIDQDWNFDLAFQFTVHEEFQVERFIPSSFLREVAELDHLTNDFVGVNRGEVPKGTQFVVRGLGNTNLRFRIFVDQLERHQITREIRSCLLEQVDLPQREINSVVGNLD
ncbi:hypothetical protein WICPIJ_003830 [Wickerhamomyces pijperi]|uniref:Uncharacterized protein n=1 Tax=Wickerhamomyces pijperi TaxID=599730 RepID=A0A9P8TND1_WICPI|nr:hypothetical protein WICPIJ_003830 [Wickerhamomyces pijperi]